MVRVNHPPGGKMKLNAEAEPDSRTVRVLKPPGGGSSIVFDEEENKPIKSKPQPQQQPPKEDTPQAETVEKQAPPPPQESGDAKPETNGMNSHDSVKEDAAASRDSFPSFPSPAPATNGQHSPAPNGSPAVNGSSAINGSVSSGSTSSMSPFPGGTPKHLNTQTRIFGEDHNVLTPRRRLRDHERSNIFADEGAANGTHRPADSSSSNSSSSCPSSGTPEARTPEQAPQPQPPQQQQQQQRQRVPPGGFSTRLW